MVFFRGFTQKMEENLLETLLLILTINFDLVMHLLDLMGHLFKKEMLLIIKKMFALYTYQRL